MPLFALANTAIVIGGDVGEIFSSNLNHGIMAGLVVGKVIGIVGFTYLAVRLGIATLPSNVTFGKIVGVGCLGGIGFPDRKSVVSGKSGSVSVALGGRRILK